MKKITLIPLLFIIIGCKKKLRHQSTQQIEDAKYEIVNKSLPKHLTKVIERLKESENYPFDFEKQIFQIPASLEFVKIPPYKKLVPEYYDLNQDTLYPLTKWDQSKLDGYKIIDTIKYNELKKLNNDKDIEVFMKKWDKEIGYEYINVANPIFNSDFTKCFLYMYYTDFDWMCGRGSNRLYEFTRKGNKWYFSKDLLGIE